MDKKLLVFDVDGTIAPRLGCELFPHASRYFNTLKEIMPDLSIALATNQGGVSWHYHLAEVGDVTEAQKYPTVAQVEDRLGALLECIPFSAMAYVCFAYRYPAGTWLGVPHSFAGDRRWSRNWRKPNPGMIELALGDSRTPARDALVVGDTDDDRIAARSANVDFMWAKDFFKPYIEELESRRCVIA